MGVSNFTGPRESKLTIPRARKMAKPSKIPRIVNEIPGNLRANSQEKAVKLERKNDFSKYGPKFKNKTISHIKKIRAFRIWGQILNNPIFRTLGWGF